MSDGHILAQTTHCRHLVRVNSVDDATSSEEQTSLKHGVCEQVEHRSHVAKLCMIVENSSVMTREANAERHHHEGNLRDCREGKHTLDVALGASYGCSVEGGESTDNYDNLKSLGSVLNPYGEETCNLKHTGNHHGGSVDKGRNRSRALHCVRQPDVQREHG